MLHILGIGLLSVFACIGFIHAAAWLAVRLSRKGNGVYKVVPVGGEGKNSGDQMSLFYACLQWESNPSGQVLLLYDAGLDERAARDCEELARGAGVRFVRSPEELGGGSCARGRRLPARLRFPARTAIMIAVNLRAGREGTWSLANATGWRAGWRRSSSTAGRRALRWLELSADGELVTVVGEFAGIAVGETLIVEGVYATHPKYGLQLKADKYERLLPATAAAIASYLSSGAIKGIGPKTAGRLVARFGDRDAHRDRTESGKAHRGFRNFAKKSGTNFQ